MVTSMMIEVQIEMNGESMFRVRVHIFFLRNDCVAVAQTYFSCSFY